MKTSLFLIGILGMIVFGQLVDQSEASQKNDQSQYDTDIRVSTLCLNLS